MRQATVVTEEIGERKHVEALRHLREGIVGMWGSVRRVRKNGVGLKTKKTKKQYRENRGGDLNPCFFYKKNLMVFLWLS